MRVVITYMLFYTLKPMCKQAHSSRKLCRGVVLTERNNLTLYRYVLRCEATT